MTDNSTKPVQAALPLSTIINYNMPTVGVGFMFFIVSLYLMKFATDELLIFPAAMGVIFFISRLWDAITDPLVGYFSDRTNLKFGRRRPWMLVSIFPICITFYMMWNPPEDLNAAGTLIWMGVSVVLFYTAMTAFSVPHTSLGAELSNNYHERTKIFGLRHMIWNTGSLLALVAMHLLIIGDNVRELTYYISLVAGMTTAALIFWMVIKIKSDRNTRVVARRIRLLPSAMSSRTNMRGFC